MRVKGFILLLSFFSIFSVTFSSEIEGGEEEPVFDENSTENASLENDGEGGTNGQIVEPEIQNILVKFSLQSPSYLIEKETDLSVYNCDKSKGDCKVNFDFSPTFTDSFKATNAVCVIDFGFGELTGEESKCNPNTVTFPIGTFNVYVKITDKRDDNHFGELYLTIKNEEEEKAAIQNVVTNNYVTTYSPTSSSSSSSNSPNMLNLQNPVIKVQSGLDSKNECNKTECSVNFIYETSEKVVCLWDFGEGISTAGNEEKCNPTYVKYLPGKHKVSLEVCDKNYDYNCKNTSFTFENIYTDKKEVKESSSGTSTSSDEIIEPEAKITLQGTLSKSKTLSGNLLTCFGVKSCSVNFTGEDSLGKVSSYFWDFGNGETSTKSNPTSMIYEEGEYTVILEITDKNGITSEDYFYVVVDPYLKEAVSSNNGVGGGNLDGDILEQGEENVKLKIEVQGQIGSNKILKGNHLTCIKTCSVNFDGSKSEGKFVSYYWDFGNGEVSDKANPPYTRYEDFGEYVVLFSVETKSGNVYEEEFYINFIEKEGAKKVGEDSSLSLLDLGDKSDILVEYGGIDYSENDKDPSKNLESSKEGITWKYPLLGMIFSGLGGSFALLRRYRIV